MNEFFKKLGENILFSAIWELIKFLVVSILAIFINNLTQNLIYPFLFVAVIVVIWAIYRYYTRRKDFQYIVLYKKLYFEYLDKKYIYNYDINAKSLVNNLSSYVGKFTCNKDKIILKCLNPINAKIDYLPKDDIYNSYMLLFNRKYNAGELFNVKVESTVCEEVLFPHFSTNIVKPTKLLEISIKLPLNMLKNDVIYLKTIPNPVEVGVTETYEKRLERDGTYTWKIENPKLRYKYSIEWNFNDLKNSELLFK